MPLPNNISNLVAWWKAEDLDYLSTGSFITSWPAYYGGSTWNLTNTTSATYYKNRLNGHSAINLSAGLKCSNPTPLVGSVFIVFRSATSSILRQLVGNGATGTAYLRINTSNNLQLTTGTASSRTIAANTWYTGYARWSSVASQDVVGSFTTDNVNASIQTEAGITGTGTQFGVGISATLNQYLFSGDVIEVILYNRWLNDEETASIQTYIYEKYYTTGTARVCPPVSLANGNIKNPTFRCSVNISASNPNDMTQSKNPVIKNGTKLTVTKQTANTRGFSPILRSATKISPNRIRATLSSKNPSIFISTRISSSISRASIRSFNPQVKVPSKVLSSLGRTSVLTLKPRILTSDPSRIKLIQTDFDIGVIKTGLNSSLVSIGLFANNKSKFDINLGIETDGLTSIKIEIGISKTNNSGGINVDVKVINLVCVKGSTSSHGGVIITGDPNFKINGKEIARKGDLHNCPLPGHGVTEIVDNCIMTFVVDGKPVAKITSITGCGAVIVSGEPIKVG